MDIYVTGLGLVTALGDGVDVNHEKLKAGQTGIGPSKNIEAITKDFLVGEFELSNKEIANKLAIPFSPQLSRTALLGLLAIDQIEKCNSSELRTGFINGTTVGGMDRSEIYYQERVLNADNSNYNLCSMHDLGTLSNFIAKNYGGFSYINTISTACSSSANSIMMAARMIRSGKLDMVIAGGTDALSSFTMNGFNSLMIYDKQALRPFDNERQGLNLGEGAGYVRLESKESIERSGNRAIAKLSGWCNANDAFHQTATSEEGIGPQLAINGALKKAKLSFEDIDYINAHGTGTNNNDQSELRAIESVFSPLPPFSSTKSFMGHTLGASGGIEAVISVMCLQNKACYPIINWKNQMEGFTSRPLTEYLVLDKLRNVLSNSFGFGGNASALIFSGL